MKNKDTGKIGASYARAMIEACQPSDWDAVETALIALSDTWKNSIELRSAILNPAIPMTSREQVLKDLAGQCLTSSCLSANNSANLKDATDRLLNFVALLLQNGRITALPKITEEYSKHLAFLKKALSVSITSAFEISDAEKNALLLKLRTECGEMTNVTWSIDTDLIGGLLVRAGDRVLDNTVRGSLKQLKENLLQ